MSSTPRGSTIIPCLRYRDAPAAIEWLCQAFGFTRHAVHEDGNGGIAHAQLAYGSGMIMLGSAREDDVSRHFIQPDVTHGRETQTPYVIVSDCRAHYEKAKGAGAEIVDELAEKDYGGTDYGCRDPEGHLWYFGSYDPWEKT